MRKKPDLEMKFRLGGASKEAAMWGDVWFMWGELQGEEFSAITVSLPFPSTYQ